MVGRKTSAFLAVTVMSGAILVWQGVRAWRRNRREKSIREYMDRGLLLLKEKMYSEAAVLYLKCLNLMEECDERLVSVYNNLTICLAKIKAYKEAVAYAGRSLQINILNNEKALRLRYECHRALEMRRETLCDAFLCGLVTKDEKYRKLAQEILKLEAEAEARKMAGTREACPSKISYENFFATFPDLFESESFVNDELVRLIRGGKYDEAFEKAEKRDDSISRFVVAGIVHVRGKDMEAVSLLENEKMIFSISLREYLKTLHGDTPMDIEDFVSKNSKSVSVLFYASKIHLNLKNHELYEKFIDMALECENHDFLYVDRIIYEVGHGRSERAQEFLNRALEAHPLSISILSIACEYYIRNKDARLEMVMSTFEEHFQKDPRFLLLKGIAAQTKNEAELAEKYFRLAIEADRRFFKPYVYLGGILLGRNDKDGRHVYEEALKCAVSYDELFLVYQALILIDVQEKIMKMYPDVLKTF
ncbi:putative mitochondrial translocase [Encephalitozoon intestinalis ATCC 50506]|uniref:Mitochondrial translocase n=1 Tax=Encephalitozoon intestinalis (strain ATCC 50506) TaxID=876142 RepID=E0S8U6_ENCIT|nr:putative mitochondrial translocase [Encephalitozoon intestinalis ATCC 50506]ADM12212.1 putative mitochondrial translocase [Encephalitozoon intestinalis ATCC 50506]UTX46020.1 anaphase-promoting complex subunit 7 [Encephalitozoon intestinalis]